MKLLIEHFKNMGSEYKISSSDAILCSSEKYDKLEKLELVDTDMYFLDEKYYHKKNETIELDGITYTISEYMDVTIYANEIKKSKTDCLTKLPNRAQLEEYLSKIKEQCVIVMCDIDDFKKVNDIYGHQTGDEVISLVGNLIKNALGEEDFAGRYGGEEFLIVFSSIDTETVKHKMEEFNATLNKFTIPVNLSLSIGIYGYNPTVELSTDAVRKADRALYYIKQNGKNAAMIYDDIIKSENK